MSEAANDETTEVEQEIADAMGDDDETVSDDETDALHSPEGELVKAAPSGPSEIEMEKGFKTVERASTSYAQKIGQAFPDGALNLAPCPLCSGYVPAFVNMDFAGNVPNEVMALTKEYLGFAREAELEKDPQIEECRVCKGYGKTRTGSKVAPNDTRTCGNCHGFGYYPPPETRGGVVLTLEPGHAPAGEYVPPLATDDVDPSGEPKILPDGRDNPNFGKWPQFKIQVAPWGTTAGLTAQDLVV